MCRCEQLLEVIKQTLSALFQDPVLTSITTCTQLLIMYANYSTGFVSRREFIGAQQQSQTWHYIKVKEPIAEKLGPSPLNIKFERDSARDIVLCVNSSNGCPSKGLVGKMQQHIKPCQYHIPNSKPCAQRTEPATQEDSVEKPTPRYLVRCVAVKRCRWIGKLDEIELHIRTCHCKTKYM